MSRRIVRRNGTRPAASPSLAEIDLATLASVRVTSEELLFPIDNAFDDQRGPGGSCWIAADAGEQTVVVAFDLARALQTVRIQVEEHGATRTQRVMLAVSRDSGLTYEDLSAIDFAFTPYGSTFQEGSWIVARDGVTHLRLQVTPNGSRRERKPIGRASLTSIVLS